MYCLYDLLTIDPNKSPQIINRYNNISRFHNKIYKALIIF